MSRTNRATIICLLISIDCILRAWGQCSFASTTLADTTWHDNTRGDVTFSSSTMSKWTHSSASVLLYPPWMCVNYTADSYIVLRTSTTVSLASGSNAYAYICMKLTSITEYSYMYYLQSLRQPELAYERVTISTSTTLTQTDVCDTDTTVPTIEYNVLVKSGFESSAAIQCPDSLLFSADYTYYGSDSSTACDTSSDTWNVCSDNSTMAFDYTTCSQQIAFSSGGVLWCVANVVSTYDYTVVYNNDSTVTGTTTERFACITTDSSRTYASIAARNCSVTQTPTTFAKNQADFTDTGHRLIIGTKYEVCASSSSSISSSDGGLSSGAIAAIVISVLYVIYVWTVTLTITVIVIVVILFQFFIILLELTGSFDNRRSPTLSVIDIPDPEKELALNNLPDVVTPSDVYIKKENKPSKRGTLLPINEVQLTGNKSNGYMNEKQKLNHENELNNKRENLDLPAVHKPLITPRKKLTPR